MQNNRDNPWKCYTHSKKPVAKGHIVYDSIYVKSPVLTRPQRRAVNKWFPGAGGGARELLFNGYGILVLQDEECPGNWLHNNVNVLNTTELYT